MRVLLRGDETDLNKLRDELGAGPWSLTREGDRWFLDASEIRDASSTEQASDRACAWLESIRLGASTVWGWRPDVHFAHVVTQAEDGTEKLVSHARDAVGALASGPRRDLSLTHNGDDA